MSRRARAEELAGDRHREIITKLAEVTALLGGIVKQQGVSDVKQDGLASGLGAVQSLLETAVTAPKPAARRRSASPP